MRAGGLKQLRTDCILAPSFDSLRGCLSRVFPMTMSLGGVYSPTKLPILPRGCLEEGSGAEEAGLLPLS